MEESKRITLRGIERSGADETATDGALNEAIGLVYKDRSFVPYSGSRIDKPLDGTVAQVLVHKTSSGNNEITRDSTGRLYWRCSDDDVRHWFGVYGVQEVAFIGNEVCTSGTEGLHYYIWNGSEYENADIDGSELPHVSLRVSDSPTEDEGIGDRKNEYSSGSHLFAIDREVSLRDSQIYTRDMLTYVSGLASKAIGKAKEHGILTGYVFATVAYRMSNGEFIAAQNPILLCEPNFVNRDGRVKNIDGSFHFPQTGDTIPSMDFASLSSGVLHYSTEGFYMSWYFQNRSLLNAEAMASLACSKESHSYDNFSERLEERAMLVPSLLVRRETSDGFEPADFSSRVTGDDYFFNGTDCYVYSFRGAIDDGGGQGGQTGGSDGFLYRVASRYKSDGSVVYNKGELPSLYTILSNGSGYVSGSFVRGNSLQFKIESDIPAKYKNDIASVCVFISREVSAYKDFSSDNTLCVGAHQVYNTGSYESNVLAGYVYRKKTIEELRDDLFKDWQFYKVAEIDFDDIVHSEHWISVDLKGKLGDSLVLQEQLPLSAWDMLKETGGKLGTYNGRLHLMSYSQRLVGLHCLSDYGYIGGPGQVASSMTQTQRESEVVVESSSREYGRSKTVRYEVLTSVPTALNPFLFVGTDEAQKLTLRSGYIQYINGVGTPIYSENIFVLKNDVSNKFSYYLNDSLMPIPISALSNTGKLPRDKEENNVRVVKNGMKVSDVEFAQYFPNSQTHRIGNGEIIGMACLSQALSQDQFGPQPLLVFTTDGIWALGVNTDGTGAYSTITPFSREVCTNSESICELDGAVMFVSDKGLMMATTKGADAYMHDLNGVARPLPKGDMGSGNGMYVYGRAITDDRIVVLEDNLSQLSVVSDDDFKDYLQDKDTRIYYVSKRNSIVVSNKNKAHVYWIDVESRIATKLKLRLLLSDKGYPDEVYYDSDGGLMFADASGDDYVDCLLQTRPLKLESDYNSVRRVVLRGKFSGEVDRYGCIYVFGSLDGEHWHLLGWKEKSFSSGGFHDLGCVTDRTSDKYVMVLFAGRLSIDSHIDALDISEEKRYINKLR